MGSPLHIWGLQNLPGVSTACWEPHHKSGVFTANMGTPWQSGVPIAHLETPLHIWEPHCTSGVSTFCWGPHLYMRFPLHDLETPLAGGVSIAPAKFFISWLIVLQWPNHHDVHCCRVSINAFQYVKQLKEAIFIYSMHWNIILTIKNWL